MAAGLVLVALTACGGSERAEDGAGPAEERVAADGAEPGGVGVDGEAGDGELGAPSARVRSAVREAALEVEEGEATFYADVLEGRRTASGRTFRQAELVAAHRAFPFGTRLRVTNLSNDREVEVEVVDRGPFGHNGSLPASLDLSKAAAERLDFVNAGRARVQIEVLEWGE